MQDIMDQKVEEEIKEDMIHVYDVYFYAYIPKNSTELNSSFDLLEWLKQGKSQSERYYVVLRSPGVTKYSELIPRAIESFNKQFELNSLQIDGVDVQFLNDDPSRYSLMIAKENSGRPMDHSLIDFSSTLGVVKQTSLFLQYDFNSLHLRTSKGKRYTTVQNTLSQQQSSEENLSTQQYITQGNDDGYEFGLLGKSIVPDPNQYIDQSKDKMVQKDDGCCSQGGCQIF